MKARINYLLFFFPLMLILASCGKDSSTTLSDLKAISSFTIAGNNGMIDESAKTILVEVPSGTDPTSLSPQITISEKATVSPASGVAQDFTEGVLYTVTAEDGSSVDYMVNIEIVFCVNPEDVHSFTYKSKKYELIKKAKTWEDAAACAVERGGYLAEINDAAENTALFNEAQKKVNTDNNETVAADGGNASYVWLGGNDMAKEGKWIWDGDDDGVSTQFWEGDNSGNAIDGLYNNWGNEPDNYNEQDALGLALTEWPFGVGSLGVAGQWNDIKHTNRLYYIIEFDQ